MIKNLDLLSISEVLLVVCKHVSLGLTGCVALGLLNIVRHFSHDGVEILSNDVDSDAVLQFVALQGRQFLCIAILRCNSQIKILSILTFEEASVQRADVI